jgi:chromosome segregation ATPase
MNAEQRQQIAREWLMKIPKGPGSKPFLAGYLRTTNGLDMDKAVVSLASLLERVEAEALAPLEAIVARRTALDGEPTLEAKVSKALRIAGSVDPKGDLARVEGERDEALRQLDDKMNAALLVIAREEVQQVQKNRIAELECELAEARGQHHAWTDALQETQLTHVMARIDSLKDNLQRAEHRLAEATVVLANIGGALADAGNVPAMHLSSFADSIRQITREREENTAEVTRLQGELAEAQGHINYLLNQIHNAAGQATDSMCRDALCAVLDTYGRLRVPGLE